MNPYRLLNTILDHVLQLLPADPAAFKRLDDIADAEAEAEAHLALAEPELLESGYPESGVQETPLKAAS